MTLRYQWRLARVKSERKAIYQKNKDKTISKFKELTSVEVLPKRNTWVFDSKNVK